MGYNVSHALIRGVTDTQTRVLRHTRHQDLLAAYQCWLREAQDGKTVGNGV